MRSFCRLVTRLLGDELVRRRVRRYIDAHGWDIAEDDEAWREVQRRRTAEEYGADEW